MYICVDSGTGVDVHLTAALVWMMLMCICVDSSTGVDDVHVHLLTVALAGMVLMCICVDSSTGAFGVGDVDLHLC